MNTWTHIYTGKLNQGDKHDFTMYKDDKGCCFKVFHPITIKDPITSEIKTQEGFTYIKTWDDTIKNVIKTAVKYPTDAIYKIYCNVKNNTYINNKNETVYNKDFIATRIYGDKK